METIKLHLILFFLIIPTLVLYSADIEKVYDTSNFKNHMVFRLPCNPEKHRFRYFSETISLAIIIESVTVEGTELTSKEFVGFVEYSQDTNTRINFSRSKRLFYELNFNETRKNGEKTGEYEYIFIKDGKNYVYKLNRSMKNIIVTYRILFPMYFPNYQKILRNLKNTRMMSQKYEVQLCITE